MQAVRRKIASSRRVERSQQPKGSDVRFCIVSRYSVLRSLIQMRWTLTPEQTVLFPIRKSLQKYFPLSFCTFDCCMDRVLK